jgi:hypothetical protein
VDHEEICLAYIGGGEHVCRTGLAAIGRPGGAPANESSKQPMGRLQQLGHPISLRDAAALLPSRPEVVDELRVDAGGINGGVLVRGIPKNNLADAIDKYRMEFSRQYGREPVVWGIVAGDQTSSSASKQDTSPSQLVQAAALLPVAQVNSRQKLDVGQQVRRMGIEAAAKAAGKPQLIPKHFPSQWEGDVFRKEVNPKGVAFYAIRWDKKTGHDPKRVPLGWGMETGFTLLNDNNPGFGLKYPFCGPNQNENFYLNTWVGHGQSWTTNIPLPAVPYADFVIIYDSCKQNGLEFGIGQPTKLVADTDYWFQSTTGLGKQKEGQSAITASASLKQNNCGGIFKDVISSTCMGLNVRAVPPNGIAQAQLYVGRNRGWVVPGCFIMRHGWSAPQQKEVAPPVLAPFCKK